MTRAEFNKWAGFHFSTIRGKDIPATDSADGKYYWDNIYHAFVKRTVSDREAREATHRLSVRGHVFASSQLAKLLDAVDEIRAEERATSDPSGLTIEEAEKRSKACQDCQGGGFATRYRTSGLRRVLYCICPLGRLYLERDRKSNPDVASRIPDLAAHPFLQLDSAPWCSWRDNPFCHPPAEFDLSHGSYRRDEWVARFLHDFAEAF